MEEFKYEASVAVADALVSDHLRRRQEPKEEKRWKFPPPVVRSVVLIQALLRRRAFLLQFGRGAEFDEDLRDMAPPDPLMAVALYFCRRSRNPYFIDMEKEAIAVAGIISAKEANLKMSDVSDVAFFYEGNVPPGHMSLVILKEKLDTMVVRTQEAMQDELRLMESPTPAKIKTAIEHCRETVYVPPDKADRVFHWSMLRLQEISDEAARDFRLELAKATTVPELDALKARVERSFGPDVQTPVREEIDTARLRRHQYLEMELETRWSRPFAGPLPPHSRAARRYELELGHFNEKVRSFVAEERRYVHALEAALEVQLSKLQGKLQELAAKRRDARARSIIADLDERISDVNLEIQQKVEDGIVQIGSDNPKVTQRARELLSGEAHSAVYSIQAEKAAEELRMEVAAADPSPEAGDRLRGAAMNMENLLDRLNPLHPIQQQLRTEFAAQLADVEASRAAIKAATAAAGGAELPEATVATAAGEDEARDLPSLGSAPVPRPSSAAPTESEPEGEDPWGAPVGFQEIEFQEVDDSVIPGRAGRLPNGGLPDLNSSDAQVGGQAIPDAIHVDQSMIDLFDGFDDPAALGGLEPKEEPKDLTAILTLTDMTMDWVKQQTEEVFRIKFARAVAEAVQVPRQRFKVLAVEKGSVKVTLAIYEPSAQEVEQSEPGSPPKSASQVYAELLEQINDPSSRLRLGELGPFLGNATVEQGFASSGVGKMEHGSIATAFLAPPMAGSRDLGGLGESKAPERHQFNQSLGGISTIELDDALKVQDKAASTLRHAWGTSRLDHGAPQASQVFRTTCPRATEDGTTQPWAVPYDRQSMYSFYSKDKEKLSQDPGAKLPKSKQKFTAHATFHITRHPVGGKPNVAGGMPGSEHHAAADSWLPEGGGAKLLDTSIGSTKDLELQDSSSVHKRKTPKKKKVKDGSASPGGASEAESPAGNSDRPGTADLGASQEGESPKEESSRGKKVAQKKKKSAQPKIGMPEDEPEPEMELNESGVSPMQSTKSRRRKGARGSGLDADATSPSGEGKEPEEQTKTPKKERAKDRSTSRQKLNVVVEDDAKKGDQSEGEESSLGTPVMMPRKGKKKESPERRNQSSDDKKKKKASPFGRRKEKSETEDEDSQFDSKKTGTFPEAKCWAGMYGGMPGTGTRRLHEEGGRLPELAGKNTTADALKAPAYVRATYRHSTVGVGPPYRTAEEMKHNSPQWTAYEMLDSSLEKQDWKRSYSSVHKIRLGKLGPTDGVRQMNRSVSLPRFDARQHSRPRRRHQPRQPVRPATADDDADFPPSVRPAWQEAEGEQEQQDDLGDRREGTPSQKEKGDPEASEAEAQDTGAEIEDNKAAGKTKKTKKQRRKLKTEREKKEPDDKELTEEEKKKLAKAERKKKRDEEKKKKEEEEKLKAEEDARKAEEDAEKAAQENEEAKERRRRKAERDAAKEEERQQVLAELRAKEKEEREAVLNEQAAKDRERMTRLTGMAKGVASISMMRAAQGNDTGDQPLDADDLRLLEEMGEIVDQDTPATRFQKMPSIGTWIMSRPVVEGEAPAASSSPQVLGGTAIADAIDMDSVAEQAGGDKREEAQPPPGQPPVLRTTSGAPVEATRTREIILQDGAMSPVRDHTEVSSPAISQCVSSKPGAGEPLPLSIPGSEDGGSARTCGGISSIAVSVTASEVDINLTLKNAVDSIWGNVAADYEQQESDYAQRLSPSQTRPVQMVPMSPRPETAEVGTQTPSAPTLPQAKSQTKPLAEQPQKPQAVQEEPGVPATDTPVADDLGDEPGPSAPSLTGGSPSQGGTSPISKGATSPVSPHSGASPAGGASPTGGASSGTGGAASPASPAVRSGAGTKEPSQASPTHAEEAMGTLDVDFFAEVGEPSPAESPSPSQAAGSPIGQDPTGPVLQAPEEKEDSHAESELRVEMVAQAQLGPLYAPAKAPSSLECSDVPSQAPSPRLKMDPTPLPTQAVINKHMHQVNFEVPKAKDQGPTGKPRTSASPSRAPSPPLSVTPSGQTPREGPTVRPSPRGPQDYGPWKQEEPRPASPTMPSVGSWMRHRSHDEPGIRHRRNRSPQTEEDPRPASPLTPSVGSWLIHRGAERRRRERPAEDEDPRPASPLTPSVGSWLHRRPRSRPRRPNEMQPLEPDSFVFLPSVGGLMTYAPIKAEPEPEVKAPEVKVEAEEEEVKLPYATFTFVVHGLNYEKLTTIPGLQDIFENAAKEAVVEEVGEGILPEHVKFVLSAGSVVCLTTVSIPPGGPDLAVVLNRLRRSDRVVRKILNKLLSIYELRRAFEGDANKAPPSPSMGTWLMNKPPRLPPQELEPPKEEEPSTEERRPQAPHSPSMGTWLMNRPPRPPQEEEPKVEEPKPAPLEGGREATRTRYQVTNSGATRQQVSMFAQSLTASIFRSTHAQIRSGQNPGRSLAAAATAAAMSRALAGATGQVPGATMLPQQTLLPQQTPQQLPQQMTQQPLAHPVQQPAQQLPTQQVRGLPVATMLPQRTGGSTMAAYPARSSPRPQGASLSQSPTRQPVTPAVLVARGTLPGASSSGQISQRSAGGSMSWSPSRPALPASPTSGASSGFRPAPGGGPAASVRMGPVARWPGRQASPEATRAAAIGARPRLPVGLSADEDGGFD